MDQRMTATELEELRARLVMAAAQSDYDHRPFMPEMIKEKFPHMMEDNQLQYSRFKRAVAEILQPRTIYEVGTGWGVSARAFLDGAPDAYLYGIDNGEIGYDPGHRRGDTLKRALIEIGREYKCEKCPNKGEWLGKKLVLEIDHVNGDKMDDTETNLRFLCPNCHSQTPTFRNKRRNSPIGRRQRL